MAAKGKGKGFIKTFGGESHGVAVAATNANSFELIMGGALFMLAAIRVVLLAVLAIRDISFSLHNRRKLRRL